MKVVICCTVAIPTTVIICFLVAFVPSAIFAGNSFSDTYLVFYLTLTTTFDIHIMCPWHTIFSDWLVHIYQNRPRYVVHNCVPNDGQK